MIEKIVNGDFATDLSSWTNVGPSSFYWGPGAAWAESQPTVWGYTHPADHALTQDLSPGGAVVHAHLTARIAWNCVQMDDDLAKAVFKVKLIDPAGVETVLKTVTKDEGDSGTELIADALELSPYMALLGTYTIRLEVKCYTGRTGTVPDYTYVQTKAFFDDVSLMVSIRLYKTVLEKIGGGDVEKGQVHPTVGEIAGFNELPLEAIGSPGHPFRMDRAGLHEFIKVHFPTFLAESAGLAEALARTYGGRNTPTDGAGLTESLRALWKLGNVQIDREVIPEDDIWEDIVRKESDWEII